MNAIGLGNIFKISLWTKKKFIIFYIFHKSDIKFFLNVL